MNRSEILFERACRVIPGGVNSPVRAFRGVGGTPVFFTRGDGPYLFDADGNRYVDYVGSWGPLILGHAHPKVIAAIQKQIIRGLSFGAPTDLEVEVAETLCSLVPSMDMVRMVNSGTEATMSAIRLARAFTGRNRIVKFEGCYHGHVDSLLVKAGSGALTLGQPTSPGIPPSVAADTLVLTYNDTEEVRRTFATQGDTIACVIVEPVAGNMNCIPPIPGFLESLRGECDHSGAVLIFDEVMTGFRVALGGAQARYSITPDLTTLGKVIGGGLPVGAFGGKRALMERIAPSGPVYQAGTLSGNPVAMACGLATLRELQRPGLYDELSASTSCLVQGLRSEAQRIGIPFTTTQVGSMFGMFFSSEQEITSFRQATSCDEAMFKRFYHSMLSKGIYFAPSTYEAGFMSTVHTPAEIEFTVAAAREAFKSL